MYIVLCVTVKCYCKLAFSLKEALKVIQTVSCFIVCLKICRLDDELSFEKHLTVVTKHLQSSYLYNCSFLLFHYVQAYVSNFLQFFMCCVLTDINQISKEKENYR